jgi:hypothetical protein
MISIDLSEQDFVAWTERRANELRALRTSHRNRPLDLEHPVEEIGVSGHSRRHGSESLLEQIIIHLLKLRYGKADTPRPHWANGIDRCRNERPRRLTSTIRHHLTTNLETHYETATRLTTRALPREEPEIRHDIPGVCPWTLGDILGSDDPKRSQIV